MKKSLKGILASVVAMLVFAPSVKAAVIELTQADFAKTDVSAKSIGYDETEGTYFLGADEYKFTEDVTLPEGDKEIYIHDQEVTIDATGYTVKAPLNFVDSNVTIVGGTFVGNNTNDALAIYNTNAVIKDGIFSAGKGGYAVRFSNIVNNSDTMAYTNNLTIENGTFASAYQAAVITYGGNNITIKNGTFTGTYAGLHLADSYKKATIEKGTFRATFVAKNEVENPYNYKGAIVIDGITDKDEIDKLLSENSAWAEDVEKNVYNEPISTPGGVFYEKAVYTQPEISVITKEERAAKDAEEAAKKAAEEATNTKKTYKVLDGEKQEYNLKSSDRLTFRFDIDYAEFVASGKVYVDDVLIDSSNYETKEGSTIVVFTKDYTDHLKVGNHTIKVVTDKGEATAEFTIKKSEKNPGTGDNAIKYIVLTILAVAAAVVVTAKRKKIFNY